MKPIKTVEQWLNSVDYSFEDYKPSEFSLGFVNFMKLVNGHEPEENKTPVVHYQLLDNVGSPKTRLAILCHRGFAKSTILSEYLPLYCAVFGYLENFGEVNYMLFIGDTKENGCRNMRKNMENRYNQSEFLQKYLPKARFTDDVIEFTNLDGHQFAIRLAGAQQSIRGTRYLNKRPELCVMDDILSDLDAKSPTCIANVNNTIHKGVSKALHPTKNKIIYVGTCFNASDPLYQVIESGRWSPSVFPVAEKFPCSREEFRGSWEDRFPYDAIESQYQDALALGRISDFNGEMMNRVISDEDRLVSDGDIRWYNSIDIQNHMESFNFYITTDFATSEKQSADYSVISVWAYNNVGYWFLVDGICRRQDMGKNIDDLFRLAQQYKPQSVGIEVTGQQGGFIPWIQREMMDRKQWFNLASDNNSNQAGIRPTSNKLVRFQTIVPWFKQGIMYFPEDLKNTPLMREAIEELGLVSREGFKSKHDDWADTASMLSVLQAWKPTEGSMQVADFDEAKSNHHWDWDDEPELDVGGLDSYVV